MHTIFSCFIFLLFDLLVFVFTLFSPGYLGFDLEVCCSYFNDLQLLMSCLFSQYRDILLSIFAASFWFYIPHVWSSCLIFDETCICLLHIACSIVCFKTIFLCVVSSNQIYFCTLLACELFLIHFLHFLHGNSFIYQYFICIVILF
jgi:hypothetical protein